MLPLTPGIHVLVAGPGIEPGPRAYETLELPFLHPAIDDYSETHYATL